MPQIDEKNRKHAVHTYLKPADKELLDHILMARMDSTGNGWMWREGWSASRIARNEGGNFTKNNVNNYRLKHFPPPPPEAPKQADLFVPPAKPPVSDTAMEIQAEYFRRVFAKLDLVLARQYDTEAKLTEMVDNRLKELERRIFGSPAPAAAPGDAINGDTHPANYDNNRLP